MEFVFNDCNACMNPNVHKILTKEPFVASVKTACYMGKWYYGYDYTNTLDGWEGGASAPNKWHGAEKFDTEQEAIKYAVENVIIAKLLSIIKRQPEFKDICQRLIGQCQDSITFQPTLF